jgi:hypothetical protein
MRRDHSRAVPLTSSQPRRTGDRRRRRRLPDKKASSSHSHAVACRKPLARYSDGIGRDREIVARKGRGGSLLVIDRDRAANEDRVLVAHLAPDEPAENAAIACRCYLAQACGGRYQCRQVTAEDFRAIPFVVPLWEQDPAELVDAPVQDGLGRRYELELVDSGMSIPELRWCRIPLRGASGSHEDWQTVSVREVVASLERYEPVRALTGTALCRHGEDERISTTVLRCELERVLESPIVLNRRLRQAVRERVERDGVSMSEIAMRCGRAKRDSSGNESGETSWLARRLGLLAEGGKDAPTPWIHSDVLALIARDGLGVSPREVEAE